MWNVRASLGAVLVACYIVAPHMSAAQQCERLQCEGDVNRNGEVTIDEIISAVNRALGGCTGCADISGVWDYRYTFLGSSCTPAHEPNADVSTLTFNQRDDCTFDGTLETSGGDISTIQGTVSGQTVSFSRDYAPTNGNEHSGTVCRPARAWVAGSPLVDALGAVWRQKNTIGVPPGVPARLPRRNYRLTMSAGRAGYRRCRHPPVGT